MEIPTHNNGHGGDALTAISIICGLVTLLHVETALRIIFLALSIIGVVIGIANNWPQYRDRYIPTKPNPKKPVIEKKDKEKVIE